MDDRPASRIELPSNSLLLRGAVELARMIANSEVSSRDVVGAFVERVQQINPQINAVCWPLLEEAVAAASSADEAQARGASLGPLHGVPITIKECFHVAHTPSTMGLTSLRDQRLERDSALVAQLKAAGAIVLGKTNVPQLMILHETDNPLYGRTNYPWDLQRTPGGSSGGEGAVIAGFGSPLGLGSDLGGSIRIPAHFCGIAGLKPSSFRLTKQGTIQNLRGMEAMHFQPGPLARRVEDVECMMRIFAAENVFGTDEQVAPLPWRESADVDVSQLRIGILSDDGYAPPHPAIRQAVEEAARALAQRGADVVAFEPPDVSRGMMLYFGLIGADGSADLKRLSKGSELDHRVASLLWLGGTSRWYRPFIASGLRTRGMHQLAEIVAAAGPRSASSYWQLTHEARNYTREFLDRLDEQRLDAIICPPHAMPAFRHGQGKANSMMAASYAFIMNLLGIPCGIVPAACVPADEASDGEAGMPVGVQVAARHWREDVVLAVMQGLEDNCGTFHSFSPLFQ